MERAPIPFDTLSGEQTQVLQQLLSNRVNFIIVGGYALRYYGHLRATKDLDLVIAQTPENIDRIRRALKPNSTEGEWNLLMLPEKKLLWWDVEIFSDMRGLVYCDMENSAECFPLFDSLVRIVSIPYLKSAKKLSIEATDRDEIKRIQDKLDLEYIERLDKIDFQN